VELAHQPRSKFGWLRSLLYVRRKDAEAARRTICLEIDTGYQMFAVEEGQHVVSKFPLGGRRINLDAVVEVEEALRPLTEPDDGIKGRE
jgi:hypothetical protein